MNIFITGATGAIGRALVVKLLQNPKLNIFVLVRNSSDVSTFPQSKNLQIIRCDFLNVDKLKSVFHDKKINFFVHLAARVSSWGKKSDFTKDNVLVTENILEALSVILTKESIFIYASTIAVYGFENNHCNEDIELVPSGWGYADSKIIAEQKIISFFRKTKAKLLILRIGDIASVETSWVSGVRKESKIGFFLCPKTSGIMYFLCIDDVVQLFLKIFERGNLTSGVYNVIGKNKIPFHYFFEQLARQLGVKMIKCPPRLSLLLSYLNVMVSGIFHIKTEFTPETTRYVLGNRKISGEKVAKEFGWKPESFCYNDYIKEPTIFN